MVMLQVNQIDELFNNLETLKANNWVVSFNGYNQRSSLLTEYFFYRLLKRKIYQKRNHAVN